MSYWNWGIVPASYVRNYQRVYVPCYCYIGTGVGWFQRPSFSPSQNTPTFGVRQESRSVGRPVCFSGWKWEKGCISNMSFLPFFGVFERNPWLWELGYQFMRNKLFFLVQAIFFWEAFCLGADDWILWCQALAKMGQSSEVTQNWLPKKLWGNDGDPWDPFFWAPFYTILLERIWSIKYLVPKIFRRNNETNLDRQSYNMHIYIYILFLLLIDSYIVWKLQIKYTPEKLTAGYPK